MTAEEHEVANAGLQSRLYATTDAMTWAEEFCKLFEGKTITLDETTGIDPGTMVGWFANYAQTTLSELANKPIHMGTWYAFIYFYHLDCSNAAFHCGHVRYSPVTFRLAEFIKASTNPVTPHPAPPEGVESLRLWDDHRLLAVSLDLGRYQEDTGR